MLVCSGLYTNLKYRFTDINLAGAFYEYSPINSASLLTLCFGAAVYKTTLLDIVEPKTLIRF